MSTSLFFIMALIFISTVIACGLMLKKDVWKWIVVYWWVLTFKNAADFWNSIV